MIPSNCIERNTFGSLGAAPSGLPLLPGSTKDKKPALFRAVQVSFAYVPLSLGCFTSSPMFFQSFIWPQFLTMFGLKMNECSYFPSDDHVPCNSWSNNPVFLNQCTSNSFLRKIFFPSQISTWLVETSTRSLARATQCSHTFSLISEFLSKTRKTTALSPSCLITFIYAFECVYS